MHSDVDRQISNIAICQGGTFSTAQLVECGGDRHLANRRVRAGLWRRHSKGVYAIAGVPLSWTSQLWIAQFEAGDDAVVSHASAARLHGFYAYRDTSDVHIVRRGGRDHRAKAGRLHESSVIDPHHVTVRDGLAVTTVARTFFDLCAEPTRRATRSPAISAAHDLRMRRVFNDALARRGLTVPALAEVLDGLGKRGRPGTRLVRSLVASASGAPTESDLETVFVQLLDRFGLPHPERQRALGDRVCIGRVDFVYRQARIVIEIDSTWHDGPDEVVADSWRDIELQEAGWRVFRFRWAQLMHEPERVAEVIRRAL